MSLFADDNVSGVTMGVPPTRSKCLSNKQKNSLVLKVLGNEPTIAALVGFYS